MYDSVQFYLGSQRAANKLTVQMDINLPSAEVPSSDDHSATVSKSRKLDSFTCKQQKTTNIWSCLKIFQQTNGMYMRLYL
jgi:hypothetical protein